MGDLISRSDLIDKIRGIVPGSQDVDFIVRLIEYQPTAYNLENVLMQLKEAETDISSLGDYAIYSDDAIKIALKGGLNYKERK